MGGYTTYLSRITFLEFLTDELIRHLRKRGVPFNGQNEKDTSD